MFVKAKDYERFLIKVKINLGQFFDKADDDVFVVLREMDTFNTLKLNEQLRESELATFMAFKEILPELIVDHNFYADEKTKMNNTEVVDLLFSKTKVATKIIKDYLDATFQLSEQKKE